MNYLETGLSHTEFFPKKTQFSPPRFIPLCGLGRKYLGLEPLPKRELDVLSNRLCRPKRQTEQEEVCKEFRETRPMTSGTGRFVGHKRMTGFQIEKMVDRLYQRRATKDFAFVDDTVEAIDIQNMTNRCDSSSESEDESEDDVKSVKERDNAILRRDSCISFRKDTAKPTLRRENAFYSRRRDVSSAKEHSENDISIHRLENTPKSLTSSEIQHRRSVSFSRDSLVQVRRPRQSMRLNIDSYFARFEQNTPENVLAFDTKREKSQEKSPRDLKTDQILSPRTESVCRARPGEERISVEDIPRSAKTESPRYAKLNDRRSTKTEGVRSPRWAFPRIEDNKTMKMISSACDDKLIDMLATFNSPRTR